MKVTLFLGLLVSSAPLAAAAADEYYIVQDVSTKQCTIVERPPTTTELVLIENGRIFFERDEAEHVIISVTSCASRAASAGASPGAIQAKVPRTTKAKVRITANKPTTGTRANSESVASRDPVGLAVQVMVRRKR